MYNQAVADRFWSKVDRSGGCWLWMGDVMRKTVGRDYGRFYLTPNRPVSAHRIAYELSKGKLMPGQVVMHRCDTPRCVRPDHLQAGTQQENMRDAAEKSRTFNPIGEGSPSAKLSDEIVREMRRRYRAGGITQKQLAAEYGLQGSQPYVSRILSGKAWGHVTV
jgi:hypothetical protein